jgi:long-chain acyl-CoA synthetase
MVKQAIDRLNAGLPRYASVRKFALLAAEFSEAAGEVTASQKLKRKAIEQRYGRVLDELYAGGRAAAD